MIDYTKFQLELESFNQIPVSSFEEYVNRTNKSIFLKAQYECYKELYARAQPSVNYDDLLKEHFDKITKGEEPVCYYERYYISNSELDYVINKYLSAYNLKSTWHYNIDLLIDNIKEGYSVDKYIEPTKDETGDHPGYRGYEQKPSIDKQINEIINDEEKSKEISKLFVDFLNNRKNYYRMDHLERNFKFSMYLGHAPDTSIDTVKNYWKSQGIEIEIDPRNHDKDYFYSEEHGYLEDETDDN